LLEVVQEKVWEVGLAWEEEWVHVDLKVCCKIYTNKLTSLDQIKAPTWKRCSSKENGSN
jgi:hypothetical protein